MPFFFVYLDVLFRLLADISENTTIDIEHVAIDSIRSLGSQEYGRATKLRRVEPTSGRSLGTDEAIEWMTTAIRLTLAERSCLRSSDIARANTITLDVVLTILRADVAGEHLQTTLGSCVCRNRLTTKLAHHRADVDNLTLTALHHLWDDST